LILGCSESKIVRGFPTMPDVPTHSSGLTNGGEPVDPKGMLDRLRIGELPNFSERTAGISNARI
jgi:hypothetical protein